MRFQSEFFTNALQRLERLTAGLRAGNPSPAIIAHLICAIDNIFVDLGRQVVSNDDLGIPVKSEEELIFRTARMIITTQFDELDQAIRRIVAVHLPEPGNRGMWQSFLHAIPLGKAELWRVTRIWLSYRRTEPATCDLSHAAVYKLALRAAFEELHKMDHIPEVERMLYRGIASVRWPEIAKACEQILVAIHVRIDIDAARPFWQAGDKWARAMRRR
jgi:hypothetical protein